MSKNIFIYPLLFISLFFMIGVSLLSLQNNDITIPQKETVVKLNMRHKFNLNVAQDEKKSSSNFFQ